MGRKPWRGDKAQDGRVSEEGRRDEDVGKAHGERIGIYLVLEN